MMYLPCIALVAACLLQTTCAASVKNAKHQAYLNSVIKSMRVLDAKASHAAREQELSNTNNVEAVVESPVATEDALSDVELLNAINDINERLFSLAESIQTIMENQFLISTRLSVLETAHEVDETEAAQPPAPEDNLTDNADAADHQANPVDGMAAMEELLGNAEEIIQDAMDLLGSADEGNVDKGSDKGIDEGLESGDGSGRGVEGSGGQGAAPEPTTVPPTPQAPAIPAKPELPSSQVTSQPLVPNEEIAPVEQVETAAGGQQNSQDTAVEGNQQQSVQQQVVTPPVFYITIVEDQQSSEENENAQVHPTRKPLAGDSAGQRSGQRPATTAAPASESGNGEDSVDQQQNAAQEEAQDNNDTEQDQQESQSTTTEQPSTPVAPEPENAGGESAETAPPTSVIASDTEDEQDEAQEDSETEQGQQESQSTTTVPSPTPVATVPSEQAGGVSDETASPASGNAAGTEDEERELGDYHRYSFRGYSHFTDARRDDLLRRIRLNLSQRQVPLAPQPYVVRERIPLDKGGYRRPVTKN